MRFWLEVHLPRGPPATNFLVVILRSSDWNALVRKVRDAFQDVVELRLILSDATFKRRNLVLQQPDLRRDGVQLRRLFRRESALLFFALELADALRMRILLGLGGLQF